VKRRTLLAAGGAAAILPLALLFKRTARPAAAASVLARDPARILDLPPGFRYRVLDRPLSPMSDGLRTPGLPDGMGCFTGPGQTWVLMRNHEVDRTAALGAGAPAKHAYDARAYGGVTRLVVDRASLELVSSNLVLTGTLRNCSGGVSPFGWLTCEESMEPGHGYVFRCRTEAQRVSPPERIPAYGRFNHEAACVDPETLVAYLTEDRADGCLYRSVPHDKAKPFEGKLQALRVKGSPGFDTAVNLPPGKELAVDWVDVPDPDPKDDTLRHSARAKGAAIVRRGEGIVFYHDRLFVAATTGGRNGTGQILKLSLRASGDTLSTAAESPNDDVLEHPDNLALAPWGDLYMAEDGLGSQYVRGLSPRGVVFDVARNAAGYGEVAGICFSPDGKVLFLNLQREGYTLAVTGPFERLSAS
jgi:secreted PhoX family phosphatase